VYVQGIGASAAPDIERFEHHLQQECSARRAALTTLFKGERYEALLASFTEFLADAPSPGALRRWRSLHIADAAQEYLLASLKRVRKQGERITSDTHAQRLHRLRIRAKRLRYALEFFADVYPGLDKLASAAKGLQDVLGQHQDACTASNRLSEYLQPQVNAESSALTSLLHGQQQQAARARREFGAEWRKFKKSVSPGQLRALLAP
jgi:CHAD domain-containing protein